MRDAKALARAFFGDLMTRMDQAVGDEILADDLAFHDPAAPPEVAHGKEGFIRYVRGTHVGIPDIRFTIDDMVSEGNRIAVRWSCQGTHTGNLVGMMPTGRPVAMTGMNFFRLENGLIAEIWVNSDALGFIEQLGVNPEGCMNRQEKSTTGTE